MNFLKQVWVKNGLYVELNLSRKILKIYKSTNQKFPGELQLWSYIIHWYWICIPWPLIEGCTFCILMHAMRALAVDAQIEIIERWRFQTSTGTCTREITWILCALHHQFLWWQGIYTLCKLVDGRLPRSTNV